MTGPARRPRPRPRTARGLAALTVVMVLFFVMALVAAYTNRNLLFEQRISANGYRATRALEAAEAGVEWTLAMLNGGRIDANCVRPTVEGSAGLTDFRSRYLIPAKDSPYGEGAFDVPWGQISTDQVYPACIVVEGALRCICPAKGEAPADIGAPDNGIGSTFRITFRLFNGDTTRSGAMQFQARGCANPGSGSSSCFAQNNDRPAVDGTTSILTTVGLVRALPVAPKAVLTAGTDVVDGGTGILRVANGDFASGLTVHAGRPFTPSADSRFESAAGTGIEGRVDNDAILKALSDQGHEAWFRAQFTLDSDSYRRQPATVRLDCSAGCSGAQVAAALALNPRNPLWADGDVNLDVAGALGSLADPVMLLVDGRLTVSANVQATGFVHARTIEWSAGDASWDGALVAHTTFTATGMATLRYSKQALDTIRLRYGSFVRAPGGWNLF